MLDLKHLFDVRVRFPVGLGELDGGRTADVVGNRFSHTSADVADVALDYGGEARFGVLAVGCDKVLAEGGPFTLVAGLDVGRLRFVRRKASFLAFGSVFTAPSMARWSTEVASLILISQNLARETTGT